MKIGTLVRYRGRIAEVVNHEEPFMGYPVVVLEFPAIFADFGLTWGQITRQAVIELGLEVIK